MAALVPLRSDFDAEALRGLAKGSRDPAQTRRLLSLSVIAAGGLRSEAAEIGGVGLQTVRDWVVAFNADGPDGLILRVLERPEIPPHTNGSENDIRACVTKRKVSGGTMSEAGRTARDVMPGLMKTCAKLGVSFFRYLRDRLGIPDSATVPPLQDHRMPRAIVGHELGERLRL